MILLKQKPKFQLTSFTLKKKKKLINLFFKRIFRNNFDTPPFDRASCMVLGLLGFPFLNNKRFTLLGELQAGDDFFVLIDNKIKKGKLCKLTGAALPKGCNQVFL